MFFDNFGELTYSPLVTGRSWMINIAITGYKIYKNETFSPIWKVSNAIEARCKTLMLRIAVENTDVMLLIYYYSLSQHISSV